MSVLEELGAYLVGQNVSVGLGTDLFLGARPDTPDNCLTLYEYPGGGRPEYVQEKSTPDIEMALIQVVGRGRTYQDTRALVKLAWVALTRVFNLTLSGIRYRSILVNGSPGLLGRDSNNLYLVAFNATVDKEVS